MAEIVYILSGSNLGDREKNLDTACDKLESLPGLEIIATSALYVSKAQDMVGEHPDFLNQVIMAEFQFRPNELLNGLEKIETDLGRTEKGKLQPRFIDLDILLFGDEIINTEELTVPHKELLNRPFAMIPLLQISPHVVHPVKKKAIAEFVTEADENKVELYKDHVARNI